MKKTIKPNNQPNKLNRKIYLFRLRHNLKKVSNAELQLTLVAVQQEWQRRHKNV